MTHKQENEVRAAAVRMIAARLEGDREAYLAAAEPIVVDAVLTGKLLHELADRAQHFLLIALGPEDAHKYVNGLVTLHDHLARQTDLSLEQLADTIGLHREQLIS